VLLTLGERGDDETALRRALVLCRALDAELHTLRVLAAEARITPWLQQAGAIGTLRAIEHSVAVNRSTRAWLESYGDTELADRFRLVHGELIAQVERRAHEIDAELLVVAPRAGRLGAFVTSLATATRIPVLVAREATGEDTVVAATSLALRGYPVLRRAAELCRRLSAPLVAVHNVKLAVAIVGNEAGCAATVPSSSSTRDAYACHLAQASIDLEVEATPVIRNEIDPVDAILGEAREREADIVVVGAQRRGWLARLFGIDVAVQVVNRARRSVLVTPVEGLGPLGVASAQA